MKFAKPKTLVVAMCLTAAASVSAETRQHGKHEHGVAQLLVAIEGGQVQLMLESPMFNLAGFGQPQNEEQEHELEEIEHQLNDPMALFDFAGATCTASSVVVAGGGFDEDHEGEHHDEHHEEEHDEHDHDEKHDEEHHDDEHHEEGHDEHDHDEKHDEEHHDDEHHEEGHDEHDHDEKHDEEGHDDHDHDDHDESTHADAKVEWVLECGDLGANPVMKTELFAKFEHLKVLEVQYLSGDKQGAEELTAEKNELKL